MRTSASVRYNRPRARGNWATSLIWGRNREAHDGHTYRLNSYTLESTLNFLDRNYLYTRAELVDKKDILRPADLRELGFSEHAHPQFRVGAYTSGYVRDIYAVGKYSVGLGGDTTFYFAGHGTAQGSRFYLIPHDLGYAGERAQVTEEGLRQMLRHSISDEELEAAFEGLHSGRTVLVIDACNSGQALEAEEKRRGPMNSKGLAQLAYEKGMYVLTASLSLQVANEEPVLGHGYLTYVLVNEGLRSDAADKEPADGAVLLREWFDYAEGRVPRLHEERMRGKTPGQRAAMQARKARELGLIGVEDVQRPRVFYRRELEAQPLVVAKPGAAVPVK